MTPTARRFLEWMHGDGDGYRDIRCISSDRKESTQFLFPLDDFDGVDKFVNGKFVKGRNQFVGVAVRTNSLGGQLKDCGFLHHLFVDLDFKAITEADARKKLSEFPFTPSAIVVTGGGLHVYWTLDTPIDLSQPERAAYAKALLQQLARHLNADLGAATPERILRIPDTFNFKYNPPAPVVLEYLHDIDDTHVVPLSELVAHIGPIIPAKPATQHSETYKRTLKDEDRVKQAKRFLERQDPAVQGQGGDQHTFNMCCAVAIGHDLDVDQALAALAEWNARCEPPWTEDELRTKLTNANQYGDPSTRGGRLRSSTRSLIYEPLSSVAIRPVHWLWEGRLPMGAMSLLAGREGIGKSILAYQLVADITKGRLAGRFFGTSKSVIVAATEDSFEHTIVPRLMAADANLNKIYRVAVETDTGSGELVLPRDVMALEQLIIELDVGLVLLDPVISRLDHKLDSHKDADVRRGLEPISRIAHDTNCVMLGIIHVNKGSATDPLNMIMGSRAFTAVARSVLFVMTDPEDQMNRMLGAPKNNLGRGDLPSLLFTIEDRVVGETPEGKVHSGKLVWKGETTRTLADELETAGSDDKSAVMDASEWLRDLLTQKGGYADSNDVKKEAKSGGHSISAIQRARKRIQAAVISRGFPKKTIWALPGISVPDDAEQIQAPF